MVELSAEIMRFLDDTKAMRSPQTYKNYRSFTFDFHAHVGKPFEDVTVRDIIDYLKHGMEKRGWKISTMREYAVRAYRLMQEVKDEQFIRDLKRELKRLPRPGRYESLYEGNYVPGDRIDPFIDAAPTEEYAAAYTMILKWGLRVEEMRSMTLENIDLQEHRVRVRGKGQGQEGKLRILYVDRGSVERVMRFMRCTDQQIAGLKPIPRDKLKKPIVTIPTRTLEYRWKRTARKIGLKNWAKLTPHDGRHSYAIDFLIRRKRQGMAALILLKNQLGHEDIKTTMIYLDIAGIEAREIFEAGEKVESPELPGTE